MFSKCFLKEGIIRAKNIILLIYNLNMTYLCEIFGKEYPIIYPNLKYFFLQLYIFI